MNHFVCSLFLSFSSFFSLSLFLPFNICHFQIIISKLLLDYTRKFCTEPLIFHEREDRGQNEPQSSAPEAGRELMSCSRILELGVVSTRDLWLKDGIANL